MNETVTNAALSPAISCAGPFTADCSYVSSSGTSPIAATTPTSYNEDEVLIEEKPSIPSSDPALWQGSAPNWYNDILLLRLRCPSATSLYLMNRDS
ncbi:hypothetical protein EVAR_25785_1 [Eumeta japonica]|uniref:Uncharacterized protein n=1 Tax=Eumeta variegata TaxID=151549 RepID=A0A4C1VUG2_EUMVA|nr:hypothetical protein EVAR_25785_1 [Eumeta japonica]